MAKINILNMSLNNYRRKIFMKIYLTIDDSPSIHMAEKVSFLKKHNIPAIFYVRGEFVKKYPKQVINAINNDFIIGNHSYYHPYFSKISVQECFDEILNTQKLIDDCYKSAQKNMNYKIVRLPFADRGAGEKAKIASNNLEKTKVQNIQTFLKDNNFINMYFEHINSEFIDSYWDWDTEDYKKKYIDNPELYIKNMENFFINYNKETAIILLHDFAHNHHLFMESMKFLLSKKFNFLNFNKA